MTLPHADGPTAIWSRDQLTVWHANLASDIDPRFEALLSSDELERAASYRTPELRRRFVTRRAHLRLLFASVMCCSPMTIKFEDGESLPAGRSPRPQVVGGPGFSAASSGDDAVFAIQGATSHKLQAAGHSLKVGVDIERIDLDFAFESLLGDNFSLTEQSVIAGLPRHRQHERFYRCWTRKEACAKALGKGLGLELSQFEVCVNPTDRLVVDAAGATLVVTDLPLRQGLVGAVAIGRL